MPTKWEQNPPVLVTANPPHSWKSQRESPFHQLGINVEEKNTDTNEKKSNKMHNTVIKQSLDQEFRGWLSMLYK